MGSEVPLERVGSSSKTRWAALAAVAVVLLVLLLLKPWGSRPTDVAVATDRAPAPTKSSAPATLSPSANLVAELDPICLPPTEWRMVTLDEVAGGEIRTMFNGFPDTAHGPTDPGLALEQVSATKLRAVGVCVPRSPVVSPTSQLLQVVLWAVSADGIAREITRPVVVEPDLYDIGEAYFAPPEVEGQFWPAGRYVFEIRRIEGPESHWMGMQYGPLDPEQESASN